MQRIRIATLALLMPFLAASHATAQSLDLPKLQGDVQEAIEKAMPAVVECTVKGGGGGRFSAVVVSEDGLVLTAAHCVSRPSIRVLSQLVQSFEGTSCPGLDGELPLTFSRPNPIPDSSRFPNDLLFACLYAMSWA